MEDGAYRWEGGYEKTWESLLEEDESTLEGTVLALIHKAKRRRLEERQKNQRLGIMRHVMLILDMSKSMSQKDFPPSRLDLALKTVSDFVDQFFDQNPIGQLGLIVTKDRMATKLADLSGNPKKFHDALRRLQEERCVGELSLQNALQVALDALKHIPTHSSREVVCLTSSLTTCDPGNVISTIQVLKDTAIKCSVIGMSAEVRVFKRLTIETGGRHDVMLDESHLRDIFTSHALPPPCPKEMESNLIRMGFPVHRIYRESSTSEASAEFGSMLSMCACHSSFDTSTKRYFTRSGYFCPQCGNKYCEIPVECVSCGRPGTSAARGRIGTAMGGMPGTARPGSRMGLTTAGGQRQINISQRPVTQQGMTGVRPATKGQRMVMDKSYFMGLLRTKNAELSAEIEKLNRSIQLNARESQNLAVYEKRAEELAQEIEDLRGTLADYNLLVDKLNTNTEIADMEGEWQQMRDLNDQEARGVDQFFSERRTKEEEVKRLEEELEIRRQESQKLMSNIDPEIQQKYKDLTELNEKLAEDLNLKQLELEDLGNKKLQMESELLANPLKREAMQLYEKLSEAEAKRDAIRAEIEASGTPEQERERLLAKIKQDNQETAAMDRQMTEMKNKLGQVQAEMEELEQELEDKKGDKNEKYKECKLKEQQIDDFMETFQSNKKIEEERIHELERKVVQVLVAISEVTQVNVPLDSKENVQLSADMSPRTLEREYALIHSELTQLEETEAQLQGELERSKVQIARLTEELERMKDVDGLRSESEAKREKLESDKVNLESETEGIKETLRALTETVDTLKSQLSSNTVHAEITKLEETLLSSEQNNYVLRDAIDAKRAETDIGPIRSNILSAVADYNQMLVQMQGGGRPISGTE